MKTITLTKHEEDAINFVFGGSGEISWKNIEEITFFNTSDRRYYVKRDIELSILKKLKEVNHEK